MTDEEEVLYRSNLINRILTAMRNHNNIVEDKTKVFQLDIMFFRLMCATNEDLEKLLNELPK